MKQERVLLADNHQNMLAGVRTLLESMFEKVFMVADEGSLLEAAEKIRPDLIIADLSLPVSGEINIVRRLNKTFPEIKLIILSVHDGQTVITECLEAGARGIVLKRTAVDDLVPAIDAVLQGVHYVSPAALVKSKSSPAHISHTGGKGQKEKDEHL
ncbi:MAG: response regulator transcription factor [Nitrospiraceae bacterium]|nr:MAG: response regulator transcription factor [Nitrospiraceae bacterium]